VVQKKLKKQEDRDGAATRSGDHQKLVRAQAIRERVVNQVAADARENAGNQQNRIAKTPHHLASDSRALAQNGSEPLQQPAYFLRIFGEAELRLPIGHFHQAAAAAARIAALIQFAGCGDREFRSTCVVQTAPNLPLFESHEVAVILLRFRLFVWLAR